MKIVIQRTGLRAAMLCSMLALAACGSLLKKEAPPPPAPVADTLPNPQVLLLGEVHDNAQGHRLRLAELQRRVAAGWRPVIVMEQFDRDNQDLLTRAARDCADPDCIIRVMEQPRWDWRLYRPVLDLAISYQVKSPFTDLPTLILYDNCPGGIGSSSARPRMVSAMSRPLPRAR